MMGVVAKSTAAVDLPEPMFSLESTAVELTAVVERDDVVLRAAR